MSNAGLKGFFVCLVGICFAAAFGFSIKVIKAVYIKALCLSTFWKIMWNLVLNILMFGKISLVKPSDPECILFFTAFTAVLWHTRS